MFKGCSGDIFMPKHTSIQYYPQAFVLVRCEIPFRPCDKIQFSQIQGLLRQASHQTIKGYIYMFACDKCRICSFSTLKHLKYQLKLKISEIVSIKFGKDITSAAYSANVCCSIFDWLKRFIEKFE